MNMKTGKWMIALLCLFLLGCDNDISNDKNEGKFWMKIGEQIIPNADIDYYDFSTHTIYFKEEQSFFKDLESGAFSVYVGDTEIYTGSIHPMYLSSVPMGPYINPILMKMSQYALTIGMGWIGAQEMEDPRNDMRIMNALQFQGKYHAGLRIEIESIHFLPNDKVSFDFQLFNLDTFDYLYLDPTKMGIGLFHYFTNGLAFFSDENSQLYTHQISVVQPEPWDVWKKEWMSVIQSGEFKQLSITYDHFDSMPPGSYQAFFYFSGLSYYQVEKEDVNQSEGRIWLGEVGVARNCVK